ncbi:hypothetical protein [Streptomyces sp. AcH 505]|uniref:hypothetical protein n=1 Tax=Streptomyces sp. AcH 505 TaxID=352211 RepID=UPI0005AA57F2
MSGFKTEAEQCYVARYWRYFEEFSEECPSFDEALYFLSAGWAAGDLKEIAIVAPDGQVVSEGAELFAALTDRVRQDNP